MFCSIRTQINKKFIKVSFSIIKNSFTWCKDNKKGTKKQALGTFDNIIIVYKVLIVVTIFVCL